MNKANSPDANAKKHESPLERSWFSLLNKAMLRKTSTLLAAVMIISMLVPVLAFAGQAWFKDVKFNWDGTVTGEVYFDSKPAVTESVYLNVYSNNNLFYKHSVSTVTYNTYSNGHYYYKFDFSVTETTYKEITLQTLVNDEEWGDPLTVPRGSAPPSTGCPPYCGGWGGGGGGGSTTPGSTIDVTNGTVDSDTLKKSLADHTNVTLNVKGDSVQIPASALIDAIKKEGATITIVGVNGTYILPLSVLDLDALAKELGVDVKDLKINVKISLVTGTVASDIAKAIDDLDADSVTDPVEFTLTAEGNGKTVNIDSFGDTYVSRLLTLKSKPTKPATGVVYDPVSHKISFVPSTTSEKDGKTIAEIKRNSNSIYTVIELDKTFDDVQGHWSQSYVDMLASKLIVDGVTDTKFEPDRSITRAEFAALLVRSLGITTVTGATYFNDVPKGEWYTDIVAAAAQSKLIEGYEDGTFRPNNSITREELAAMVVRALRYAGVNVEVDSAKQAQLLSAWSDSNRIIWGHKEVAAALEAGIVNGMTDTTLGTDQNATRAQSATMLKRFLQKANFIN
ncbi:S-layer homology domain-containing protein [Paenibacillus sp. HJGM_3]|uniref:S-layer homology domain-containing protein n=1 Tax=Paenibacillus sp. HJGM_3 TaxID=3379816 RepID=UPI00385842F8